MDGAYFAEGGVGESVMVTRLWPSFDTMVDNPHGLFIHLRLEKIPEKIPTSGRGYRVKVGVCWSNVCF